MQLSKALTWVFATACVAVTSSCGSAAFAADTDRDEINATIVRFKAGIDANPKNYKTRKGLGLAYLSAGNVDGAIEQFKEAIKLKQDDIESYVGLARAQIRKGNYKEAGNTLKNGLKYQPNDADAHYKLGQVLSRTSSNPDDAMNEFKTTIKLNANHSGAHRDLGMILGLKNDYDGQIVEEKKANELKPDDPDTLYYLGNAYALKNERKEALKALQRCVELDKKNVDAFRLLAGINAADGNYPVAIKYAESACTLEPDNKEAKVTLEKIKAAAKDHK
jgi:tetratricopeptide (TPR) repeat protein